MKIHYGLIFLLVFTHYKVRADRLQETTSLLKDMVQEDVFLSLKQHVYDLLEEGYSVHQIICMLNDNSKKKYSQSEVVTIVADNKEREKYYARKNFRKTVKDVMALVAIVVIVICIVSIKNYFPPLSWIPKFLLQEFLSSKITGRENHEHIPKSSCFQDDFQKQRCDKIEEVDYRMPLKAACFVDSELYKTLKQQADYANTLGLEVGG